MSGNHRPEATWAGGSTKTGETARGGPGRAQAPARDQPGSAPPPQHAADQLKTLASETRSTAPLLHGATPRATDAILGFFIEISVTASLGDDVEQCLVHLTIVSIIFIYLFLANYAGQEITDHNDNVYSTAYNVRWYVAPLHIQKLILFLLQRGSKAVNLNLGGMCVMSLELFATLTKTSISYFTVVYSMQQ
ncbi:odorant receptor 49b-like [Solenopsis invicta]|uniref:odorant receptor 49b-like n=1 Tax=Solenopsis invicta TaxID=13686 RepID=UPI00193DF3C7|nr:odorant receptor 49b-like [Solenopsis invicta]